MNSAEVMRRLAKEKKQWLASGVSPEIYWTVHGISLSMNHVRDILKEQTWNERIRKPRINRWFARDLYHAATVALGHLMRAERRKAIFVLEKVIERAAPKEDKKEVAHVT
jgi:hypothetical protein